MSLFNDITKDIIKDSHKIMGMDYLSEANLNRIMKHGDEEGFVVLSANRSAISGDIEQDIMDMSVDKDYKSLFKDYMQTRDASETDIADLKNILKGEDAEKWLKDRNKSADEKLKKDIIKAGYSYSEVFGGYHGSDNVTDSYEPSYIVYNRNRNGETGSMLELVHFAMDMCKKYYQDSVYIKMPGKPAFYLNKDGEKVSKREGDNTKFNRDKEMFYTTTKRDKTKPQRFTSDIEFPEEDEDFTPEKIFEGKLYRKNIEYIDRMRRRDNGEIFL